MDHAPVLPLFELDRSLKSSDASLIAINTQGYNQKSDIKLISANNDMEAICHFLIV